MFSLSRELNLFMVAITVLTRIPVSRWVEYDSSAIVTSCRYFPVVGGLIGVVNAIVFTCAMLVFSVELSLILMMAGSVLLTGAFHEDGFADCCDGFGGGWDKEQVLAIMKDSSIGTYGMLGLCLMLAGKLYALSSFSAESIVVVLILAHALSRLISISFLYDHDYVQYDSKAKFKPLIRRLDIKALSFSIITVLPLMLWLTLLQICVVAVGLLLLRFFFGHFIRQRIGGYTGDCLGAVQQLAELLVYLLLLSLGF